MSTKNYSYEQVYDATVGAFDALYTISRANVKAVWRNLSRKDQLDAARGLVQLRHVGKNPDKYFGRAHTERDWHQRAHQYATKHNLSTITQAYYLVPSPVGMAEDTIQNIWIVSRGNGVLGASQWADWYALANSFMNYDYNRTSDNEYEREHTCQKDAAHLMGVTRHLSDRATEIKARGIKRAWLQLVHGFKTYEK